MSDPESSIDRINRIKNQQAKREFNREKAEHKSTVGKIAHEVNIIQKFIRQVAAVLIWMWWNIGNPVFNMFTMPLFKKLFGWYIKLWNKFAFYTNKYDERKLSYKRGTILILSTLFVCFTFLNTLFLVWDTGWYYGTRNVDHVMYLSFPQEIFPDSNVFSMRGCEIGEMDETSATGCDDGLYYRVRSAPFHQIWSLTNGKGLFFPDQVISVVSGNWAKCTVTRFGIRAKPLVFLSDVYPEILSAKCEML